jgi:aminoglycoside 6'-N-acetyltransferase
MLHEYRFQRARRDDLAMLELWLAEPHLSGWWGDPGREIVLINEEIDGGPTDMRIVWTTGANATPFAFVQDYPVQAYGAPQYADAPHASRALDTFLGDPAFLGQGHAKAYLRQRARALIAGGAGGVFVDPDPRNNRAIAAYASAGFRRVKTVPCEDGDPVLVMEYCPH